MLLSSMCFAIMAACVKSLADYPLTEKVFFRNIIGMILSVIILKRNNHSLKGNNTKFLMLRSITGMLGLVTYFYAIDNLYLPDAVILNNISPFFVIILSFVFLKENINKYQIGALIFALLGAASIIRPSLNVDVIPAIIGLLSAFVAGISYVTVRYLRNTDRPDTIVFYFTLITSLGMLPFALYGDWIVPTGLDILRVLAVGIFATGGQYGLTYAYRFAKASEVSVYSYTTIIFSSLIGISIFGESLEMYTVLGGLLIIGGGLINYYCERLNKSKES